MGKALKTFIILNLLLSGTVVWFAYVHFVDREVIKARGLMHEDTMRTVAQNLGWGREASHEEALRSAFQNNTLGQAPEIPDPMDVNRSPFSVPQPIHVDELGSLQMALNELERFANQRFALLNLRTSQLIAERERHQQEWAEHERTKEELRITRDDLRRTRETLAQTQNELQQANRTIDGLRADKANLERQVAALTNELAEKNERIDTLEVDLEATNAELTRAFERIERLEKLWSDGETGPQGRWSGVQGTVLEVNSQWQFVVIDLGEVDRLELFLNAFVHRGDTYIGQVNVIRVENTVAVAEILPDTMEPGMMVEVGDTIFFN